MYASVPLGESTSAIRLLDIECAPGAMEDRTIKASLRTVDLADKHPFAALSYVWGDPYAPKDIIYCGQYSIEVTKNCWSAIWHLRKKHG